MKKVVTIVLSLLVSFTLVISARAGHRPQIEVVSAKYPNSEYYDEFVGLFNSALIEELKKAEGQGFPANHWGILLSPFSAKRSRVKIVLIREGEGERPVLIAVLSENASFAEIQQVVGLVIGVVQRGGVK